MKFKIFQSILFILIGFQLTHGTAQSFYACSNKGGIYRIDPAYCKDSLLCNLQQTILTDMAFNNGSLYGITSLSKIYLIDTLTGNMNCLVQLNNVNASNLASDENGHLYFAGSNFYLYRYDIYSNRFLKLGPTDSYLSAGDLAFSDDTLYMTSTGYELIRICLQPYSCTKVGDINLYGQYLYGLAFQNVNGTKKLFLSASYQYGNSRYYNDIYEINRNTAGIQLVCGDISGQPGISDHSIWGMATRTEKINLEANVCKVLIYPVPSDTYIKIQNESSCNCTYWVTMVNILGQSLYSQSITLEQIHTIDLSTLANGVYLLGLRNQNDYQVKKIIIQH